MNARVKARILRQCRAELETFGLDFAQFDEGRIEETRDGLTCDALWVHRTSGQVVRVASIWYRKETGEILQRGVSYGDLTL